MGLSAVWLIQGQVVNMTLFKAQWNINEQQGTTTIHGSKSPVVDAGPRSRPISSIWLASLLDEELELTANSLGAHVETHGGLILRTLSYLTVNSQDDSHCELAVSFPWDLSFLWVCNSHSELAVSYSWDHQMSSPCSGSSELTVRAANSWKA